MNIEKAIKILTGSTTSLNLTDYQEAIRLGLEALKRVKDIRRSEPVYGMDADPVLYSLLPGETVK